MLAGLHQVPLGQPVAQRGGVEQLVLPVLEIDAVDEALNEVQRLRRGLLGCGVSRGHNYLYMIAGVIILANRESWL